MQRRAFILVLLAAPAAAREWRRDNRELCERIDRKLAEIESKRRAGYTAKQGRRLLEQREKAERERRDKCR